MLNAFHLFQHEEVQFLENELENQKQKYQELASFTKSLLTALRTNDLERQQVTIADESVHLQKHVICAGPSNLKCCCLQELMASLPQPSDQDWDISAESGAEGDVSPDHDDFPAAGGNSLETPPALVHEDVPLVQRNKDVQPSAVTEPSASEEPLQEERDDIG